MSQSRKKRSVEGDIVRTVPATLPSKGNGGSSTSSRGAQPPSIGDRPGTTPPVELDRDQMHAAFDMLSDRYVRMCNNAIVRKLFERTMIIAMRGVERLHTTEQFNHYLTHWMLPFARDAYEALQAFGIVPVAFKMTETGDVAPYVPQWPAWTVTVHAEAALPIYRFYWRSGLEAFDAGVIDMGFGHRADVPGVTANRFGDYDPDVYVVHDLGAKPRLDGGLRSNMASIVREVELANSLVENAVVAETRLADPDIVLERDTTMDQQAAEAYEENFYSGSKDRADELKLALTFERNAQHQQQMHQQFALYERVTKTRHPNDKRPRYDDMRTRTVVDGAGNAKNVVLLPPTRRIVTAQLPVRNTQLTQTLEHVQHVICGILNVPRALLASESTVKAGVEATSETMATTVQYWANELSKLMTMAYEHAFGQRDFRKSLRTRVLQRERRHANGVEFDASAAAFYDRMDDERDCFQADQETRVVLTFDLSPTAAADRLDYAYNRGLIGWQPYCDRALAQIGVPRQLGLPRDPFSREERMTLVGAKTSEAPESRAAGSKTKSNDTKSARHR